jgi:pseudouridine-5'-phosphate glycosidase
MRVDGAEEIAAVLRATLDLDLPGGLVVAHPIPLEDEIPSAEIGAVIAQALADMDARGISGKDATPYLLGRIVELTDGASLTANIALVRANARLGAEVAASLSRSAGQ